MTSNLNAYRVVQLTMTSVIRNIDVRRRSTIRDLACIYVSQIVRLDRASEKTHCTTMAHIHTSSVPLALEKVQSIHLDPYLP